MRMSTRDETPDPVHPPAKMAWLRTVTPTNIARATERVADVTESETGSTMSITLDMSEWLLLSPPAKYATFWKTAAAGRARGTLSLSVRTTVVLSRAAVTRRISISAEYSNRPILPPAKITAFPTVTPVSAWRATARRMIERVLLMNTVPLNTSIWSVLVVAPDAIPPAKKARETDPDVHVVDAANAWRALRTYDWVTVVNLPPENVNTSVALVGPVPSHPPTMTMRGGVVSTTSALAPYRATVRLADAHAPVSGLYASIVFEMRPSARRPPANMTTPALRTSAVATWSRAIPRLAAVQRRDVALYMSITSNA
eukprot:Opistho-2@11110